MNARRDLTHVRSGIAATVARWVIAAAALVAAGWWSLAYWGDRPLSGPDSLDTETTQLLAIVTFVACVIYIVVAVVGEPTHRAERHWWSLATAVIVGVAAWQVPIIAVIAVVASLVALNPLPRDAIQRARTG